MTVRRMRLAAVLALTVLAGCTSAPAQEADHAHHTAATSSLEPPPPTSAAPTTPAVNVLPGMPRWSTRPTCTPRPAAGMLTPAAAAARPLVYVPHSGSGEVRVIDPATFQEIDRFPAGIEVQHVVPSYDMQMLYATDDIGNTITPIDPRTGAHGDRIPVIDPYNMYFWPDGSAAVSVAEARRMLVFYDPHTWVEQGQLPIPDCGGIDHADFTADGRTAVFTCEFAGRVAVVDVASRTLLRIIDMPVRNTHMGPQDIKLSPDGQRFYIADSDQGGLWVLDGAATAVIGQIPLGAGTHGIYPSRDATRAVRDQPDRRHGQRPRPGHGRGEGDLAGPRRQPRHGRGDGGRHAAVAVRPLQPGGLRDLDGRRCPARPHPGRGRAARAVRLAAARPVLAGAHGRHALTAGSRRIGTCGMPSST